MTRKTAAHATTPAIPVRSAPASTVAVPLGPVPGDAARSPTGAATRLHVAIAPPASARSAGRLAPASHVLPRSV
jgi:hypothetical protein